MENRSMRLMLLGIGVLLFFLASRATFNVFVLVGPLPLTRDVVEGIYAILPVVGLALVVAGYFAKSRS